MRHTDPDLVYKLFGLSLDLRELVKEGVLIVVNFKKGSQELVFFTRDAYISLNDLVD